PEYAPSLGLFDTLLNFLGWLFGTKLGWATLAGLWFVFNAEQAQPPIPLGYTGIYSAPTVNAKVAKVVPDDATVTVQQCSGGWVQVSYDDVTGWVPWGEFDGRDVCN
ncbi:MAG: SH3 domain-containing protein, partial [Cyanobacteria bacterium J06642_11]